MSKSNLNGRALEFFITKTIIDNTSDIIQLGDTMEIQNRDISKIDALENRLDILFTKASKTIFNWLKNQINIKTIQRFHDSAGKESDVTDIQLSDNINVLNISVKSNHLAIKHQRPGSLIQQFGISKGTTDDIQYRKEYEELNKLFHRKLQIVNPSAKLFNEVEAIKDTYIYEPICSKVAEKINTYGEKSSHSSDFQSFLIGKTDFIKIIVYPTKITILLFNNLPKSSKMSAEKSSTNYVNVDFHNGIKVKMRLHTASSRISTNLSLKFDSQLSDEVDIPSLDLPIE
jgi:hypothetical protein